MKSNIGALSQVSLLSVSRKKASLYFIKAREEFYA